MAVERDTRTSREKLLDVIADLEREQEELVGRLAVSDLLERQARVDALTRDPGKRSDATGAASPVRKIGDSTRRDVSRLTNVGAELEAARIVLANLEADVAARGHDALVKANRALRAREQDALDALGATASVFVEQFKSYAAVIVDRGEIGSSDPDLQPVVPVQATEAAMFAWLIGRREHDSVGEVGTFPAAAPASAVVGVRRSDPRWATLSRSGSAA